eukprot:TRINITY_DN22223_c0_g1_i1.p1 TRINITY_DN22223_c0_g1~~TRINITY_DN22223_c0_g1_i1.p1  ORF type:complete len:398 (-),score=56.58 TRINITY_DN22223_c0_g1_i1:77-1270(-)
MGCACIAVSLIAVLGFMTAFIVLGVLEVLPIAPAVLIGFIGGILLAYLILNTYGASIRYRGPLPFNAAEYAKTGCKHVRAHGRVIEYSVYGSDDPEAPVLLQCPGGGGTARGLSFNSDRLREINVKGVSISYPGHGYSDMQPGRRVRDWPKDVEAVLAAEGIGKFMVEGASLGTPHAMVVASHFKERCVALGLIVPMMSDAICKESGMVTCGQIKNPLPCCPISCLGFFCCASWSTMKYWIASWKWGVTHMSYWDAKTKSYCLCTAEQFAMDPRFKTWCEVEENKVVLDLLIEDMKYNLSRGIVGPVYAMECYDTLCNWGFDPRDITCKHVAVWYASDDHENPPEHGKWLAEMFKAKAGVKTNIRCENGFDHLTFSDLKPENFMAQTLLDLVADVEA